MYQNDIIDANRIDGPVHYGFGNRDASILIVEQSPSEKHFRAFDEYQPDLSRAEYRTLFQAENGELVTQWPMYEEFVDPIVEPCFSDYDPFGDVRVTSAVKELIDTEEDKTAAHWRAYSDRWGEVLKEEIQTVNPDVIVTAGVLPAEMTAVACGADQDTVRGEVRILDQEWWGATRFELPQNIPVGHAIHWSAYKWVPAREPAFRESIKRVSEWVRATL